MWSTVLLACSHPSLTVEVTPGTDPVNVATATVTVDPPAAFSLEYGTTEAYGSRTASSTEAVVDLLELHADTVYHLRAVTEDGSASDDVTFTTGSLPAELPALEIEGADDEGAPLTVFSISVADEDLSAIYVLDDQATVVWYTLTDGIVLASHPTRDGTGLAMQVSRVGAEGDEGDATTLEVVPWNGGERLVLDNPLGHHDFVELPDGSFAAIAQVRGKFDGRAVIGDKVELLARDGTTTTLWDAFEQLKVAPNDGWALDPADWTHANGIDYDPEADTFALSLFRQQSILFFDGDARPVGTFGAFGDYTLAEDAVFGPQHGPRFTDEGIDLFDNAGSGVSRWVSFALADGAATLTHTVNEPWGAQTLVCGDGLRRDDGRFVTAWGDLGYVATTSDEGELLRVVRTRPTGLAGRVGVLASLTPEISR